MALDLGKMYGPLPLGGWIIAGGAGLGIAYYTKRQASAVDPVPVDDTSGIPGVGTGAVGGWVPTTATPTTETTDPTTNEEWAQQAIRWGIAQGYPPNTVDSAVRKYITGAKLSVQEYTILGLILASTQIGPPPQVLPPGEDPETVPTTPTPSNVDTNTKQLNVMAGYKIDQWINDVRRQYNPSFSYGLLLAYNPPPKFIPSRDLDYHGKGSADNAFKRAMTIRIRL